MLIIAAIRHSNTVIHLLCDWVGGKGEWVGGWGSVGGGVGVEYPLSTPPTVMIDLACLAVVTSIT